MSALDIPLVITRFPDTRAQTSTQVTVSLRELAGQLSSITAPTKAGLPLLKLAVFGTRRSGKRCLRHDGNVVEVTGLELDYDAGLIPPEAAAHALHAARIPGVIYTSPSHRPDAPRWRFFSPLSKAAPPEERARLVSRIAGALPATIEFGPESWTLSQSFFIGRAQDAVAFTVILVDGDYLPVDQRPDLDATARAKPRPAAKAQPSRAAAGFDPGPGDDQEAPPDDDAAFDDAGADVFDPAVAREIILHGHPGMHDAMRGLAWHLASYDLPELEIVTQIYDLYWLRPDAARDARWQRDWQDIPRTVASAIEKISQLRAEQDTNSRAIPNDPWFTRSTPDQPDPLIAPTQPQAAYPLDQLPASFAEPVHAVACTSEADPSLAGTITLSAMAAATAKLAIGVEVDEGLVFPISLYTADIVGSSERKTTAERRVYAGIHAVVNDELVPEYQLRRKEYNAALAIYERDKRSILSQRKKGTDSGSADAATGGFDAGTENGGNTLAALMGLHEPSAPPQPHIVTNDFTIEGMRDALAENSGQLAVVTSEGAVMFNGYSLGDKTRRGASVGALSRYWDGLDEAVIRAKGRVITIHEPRVSLSIGVQPRIASTFFADLELRDQGIVNRFLITWPAPLAGSRNLDPPRHEDLEAIRRFTEQSQRCLRLAHGLTGGLAGSEAGSVEPRTALTLSLPAREAWRAFAKQVERQQAKDAPYEHITGWAGKAAEQAARIALIVTLFADPEAQVVGLPAMQAGITLARWYCDEWLRICEVVEPSPELKRATRVLEWLRVTYGERTDGGGQSVTFTARDIYRSEIAGISTREPAEQMLQILAKHGEIETSDPPKPKRTGRPPLVRWRLVACV